MKKWILKTIFECIRKHIINIYHEDRTKQNNMRLVPSKVQCNKSWSFGMQTLHHQTAMHTFFEYSMILMMNYNEMNLSNYNWLFLRNIYSKSTRMTLSTLISFFGQYTLSGNIDQNLKWSQSRNSTETSIDNCKCCNSGRTLHLPRDKVVQNTYWFLEHVLKSK